MTGSQSGRYEAMVQKELSSGVRNDSLFLGISFGMDQKEFYTHCWKLNKEGKLIQGPNNLSIQYELVDELKSKAWMHFYPNFYHDKVVEMPMVIGYQSWSPWVTELATDSLLNDVIALMEQWYGKGFIKLHHKEKGDAYVKINGNRRIGVYIKGENKIAVLITDLTAKNEMLGTDMLDEM